MNFLCIPPNTKKHFELIFKVSANNFLKNIFFFGKMALKD